MDSVGQLAFLLVLAFAVAFVAAKFLPPAMTFLFKRMTRAIAPCPSCGAIVAAEMRRAVPRRIGFWATNVAGAILFLTAFFPCIFGLMSVTGSTVDAYAGPVWYLGFFALAISMFVGGLKLISRPLRYPVTHCTNCGYRTPGSR